MALDQLTTLMLRAKDNHVSKEKITARNEIVLQDILACIETIKHSIESCYIFGSSSNNFYTAGSDVDIMMNLNRFEHYTAISDVMEALDHYMQKSDKFCVTKILWNARIPLVTGRHLPTGTKFDITFDRCSRRVSCLLNTWLLETYANADPIITDTFRFFKSRITIPGADNHGLSSYARILLFINYLLETNQVRERDNTGLITKNFGPRPTPWSRTEMYMGFLVYLLKLDTTKIIGITPNEWDERRDFSVLHTADPFIKNKNVSRHCNTENWDSLMTQCREEIKNLKLRGEAYQYYIKNLHLYDKKRPVTQIVQMG